jgi:uroporphyrinogen-III synthase
MLQHYNSLHKPGQKKLPLLFLVGKQRRDVIPKTLMNEGLIERAIVVDELVVYETDVKEDFEREFEESLEKAAHIGDTGDVQWVFVFSPTGCEAMMRVLGLLGKDGKVIPAVPITARKKSGTLTLVGTIGPTTRDYLKKEYNFEPDVCAKKPSPDGVAQAILDYMQARVQ